MSTRRERKPTGEVREDEQRTSNEVVGLIQKLRWIGMEREAERLQVTLARTPATDSVLAMPRDTD